MRHPPTRSGNKEHSHPAAAVEEEDPIIQQLGDTCAQAYKNLEECLIEHDRDWKKCQSQVKALQLCSSASSPVPEQQ